MPKLQQVKTQKVSPIALAGTLFSHPDASVMTGKRDGKMPKLESLPFIKRKHPKEGGYDYWAVKPSGDYARDCATGGEYAKTLLPFLKYSGGIALLGPVVLDMIRSGADKKGKGLVIGFMAELSREFSLTRSSLALYAAAAAAPKRLPAPLRGGRSAIKEAAAKMAIPTIKWLGNVI